MTIEPYLCKLTNTTFSTPCSVLSCPAHVDNLNRCGVKVVSTTNCAHADFINQGFSESLSYAVEEQGFVGYRDLKYMEAFFNVNDIDLRDIYTQNVTMFRKIVALTWAIQQTQSEEQSFSYCKNCGYPIKSNQIKCISSTICEERKEIVSNELKDLIPFISEEVMVSFFHVMWRSLATKFNPSIEIESQTLQAMQNVKGPNL